MGEIMDLRSGYGSDGIYRCLRPPVQMLEEEEMDLVTVFFSGNAGNPSFANVAALVDAETGQKITFGELRVLVRSIAAGLAELGVRKGSVVLVLMGNSIYFPPLFMAITSIGAIITTMNPVNTRHEIAKQMQDSGARFVITVPELVHKVEGGVEESLSLVLLGNNNPLSVNNNNNNRRSFLSVTPLSKLLTTDPDKAPRRVFIRQTDTAALLYSSGTTGASKGVIIPHKSFIAAQIIVGHMSQFRVPRVPPGVSEVFLGLVPFFHVFGLGLVACAELRRGVTVVVMSKFGGVADLLETVQKYKVTYLPVVPPIVMALCSPGVTDPYDLSSVLCIGCGAAPLSKELTERCNQKIPNATVDQVEYPLQLDL
jgi:4-coumarate--CoA ligase